LTVKSQTYSLFSLTTPTGTTDFYFNLQYYNPSVGAKQHNPASGAYIFAPDIDDQSSHPYSKIETMEVTRGDSASSFVLYYRDEDTKEVYTAIIRLIEGVDTVEYEV
jgi:hypothetical protein